ncbi:ependymin-like 1 [Aulostomus maculatus]
MRELVVLACALAGCLAQTPHPCASPPLLSGALTVSTQNEQLWTYTQYLYDALGQRIRLREMGIYQNKSFTYDALLLFREGTMYEINSSDRTCKKAPLSTDFQPLAIPKNSSLLGQAVLGSSSGPGQGLLVNTWSGDLPNQTGKYMTTVTEFGCIPVSTAYQTDQFGWVLISFFNNIIGISDPSQLNPPDFCQDGVMRKEATDFLSLFLRRNWRWVRHQLSNNTCYKKALAVDFHPLATPPNASLVGQLVMGSSPGLGRGVLVNTWVGELQINEKTAKYVSTVTELGCVPVSTLLHTSASGWLVTSFFNNVIGPADPQLFVPPPLCTDAQLEQTGEPVTFFSWF